MEPHLVPIEFVRNEVDSFGVLRPLYKVKNSYYMTLKNPWEDGRKIVPAPIHPVDYAQQILDELEETVLIVDGVVILERIGFDKNGYSMYRIKRVKDETNNNTKP